ncbi:MAG: type I secretion system permease/ATPase [Rhodospirillales bacterium]|nr:type I secretion system permease/ATPase [Rhodospirillales bacterium]
MIGRGNKQDRARPVPPEPVAPVVPEPPAIEPATPEPPMVEAGAMGGGRKGFSWSLRRGARKAEKPAEPARDAKTDAAPNPEVAPERAKAERPARPRKARRLAASLDLGAGKDSPVVQAMRAGVSALAYAAVLSLVVNLLQLVVPVYMLQIYDRVISSHSVDTLVMLTIMAIAALVFMALIDYVRARVWFVMGGQLARRLDRVAIQAAVAGWVSAQTPEARQAPRDLNELRLFITGGGLNTLFDLLCAPLFLVVLFLLHPMYGAVAVAATVLLVGMALAMEFIGRRPMGQTNEATLRAFNEVGSAIRNGEAIEAMGMLSSVARRWRQHYGHAIELHEMGHSRAKAIGAIAKALRLAVQIAMLATGVMLVMERMVSPGSMIAASIIMGRMLLPFEQLVEGSRQWASMAGVLGRLRKLIEAMSGQRQQTPLAVSKPRLSIERCVFVPPGQEKAVLKGVSFSVEPGEVLGVVGPSAAGKSTLARLLVGVWKPSSGGIYLDGHDVYTWERESFGRAVGYVPQQPMLLNGTVRDNIARLSECDPREVIEAARLAEVHEMIGRLPFGYDTVIGEGGYTLSGGQQQRIALARALFGRPQLLVLDEPNSNLDTAGERALLQAISAVRAAGTTVVLIAHRPSVIAIADKLLVLKDGMVEQFGERTDVIKTITPGGPAAPPPVIDQGKPGSPRLVRS